MKFEEQSFVVIGGARPEGIGLNFVKELLTIGVRVNWLCQANLREIQIYFIF